MILYHSGHLGGRKLLETRGRDEAMILYHSGARRPVEGFVEEFASTLPEMDMPHETAAVMLKGRARLVTFADILRGEINGALLPQLSRLHSYLCLDSGAFSVAQGTVEIDVDLYDEFLTGHSHLFEFVTNLDVIRVPNSAELSWENLKELEARGHKPVPVFHVGEDWQWLERMCEEYDYIGLGGWAGSGKKKGVIDEAFDRIPPHVKVHGFGAGPEMIAKFPWYSVDSTTWLAAARFGNWPPFHTGIYTLTARVLPWLEYLDGVAAAVGTEFVALDGRQESLFDVVIPDTKREKGVHNVGPAETCWPRRMELEWHMPRLPVLLVGQAPGPATDPEEPLSGASGKRLAKLLGMSFPEYLDRVPRANLLSEFPGKAGDSHGGDEFDMDQGKEEAAAILRRGNRQVRLVLLGRTVAQAFGVGSAEFFEWQEMDGHAVVVAPHPSGNSTWWNDGTNRDQAVAFFNAIGGEGELVMLQPDVEPVLPDMPEEKVSPQVTKATAVPKKDLFQEPVPPMDDAGLAKARAHLDARRPPEPEPEPEPPELPQNLKPCKCHPVFGNQGDCERHSPQER